MDAAPNRFSSADNFESVHFDGQLLLGSACPRNCSIWGKGPDIAKAAGRGAFAVKIGDCFKPDRPEAHFMLNQTSKHITLPPMTPALLIRMNETVARRRLQGFRSTLACLLHISSMSQKENGTWDRNVS